MSTQSSKCGFPKCQLSRLFSYVQMLNAFKWKQEFFPDPPSRNVYLWVRLVAAKRNLGATGHFHLRVDNQADRQLYSPTSWSLGFLGDTDDKQLTRAFSFLKLTATQNLFNRTKYASSRWYLEDWRARSLVRAPEGGRALLRRRFLSLKSFGEERDDDVSTCIICITVW